MSPARIVGAAQSQGTGGVLRFKPSATWESNPITQRLPKAQRNAIIRAAVLRASKAAMDEAALIVGEQYTIARRYLIGSRYGAFRAFARDKGQTAVLVVSRKKLPINKAAGFTVRELKGRKKRKKKRKSGAPVPRKGKGRSPYAERLPVTQPRPTQNMGGVLVQFGPGKAQHFRRAFVAKVQSDAQREQGIAHRGVFSRAKTGNSFHRRLPIRERFGPSVLDTINTDKAIERIHNRMIDTLNTRLMAGLSRFQ
jgi:hypothetical protein